MRIESRPSSLDSELVERRINVNFVLPESR
jgi:hypothetical protein